MNKSDRLAAFATSLRQHHSYVIVGHVSPDPDCLGTSLALGWGLQQLGKRVTVVSPDPVPDGLMFLLGATHIAEPPAPKADVLLVVDCDLQRTGQLATQAEDFSHIYNLDHHISNDATGPRVYVDASAAATAEIALELLVDHWGLELSLEAAFNLYTALLTDTGGFRFNNTTANTLRAAARLVEMGVHPGTVAGAVYENVAWSAFELLRQGLQSLRRSDDGRIAWIVLTQDMLAAAGASEDDSAGLAQYPRMIAGVDVSLLLKQMEDGETRVSFRSKGSVDVSVIAAQFGGGGHPGAAGCTIGTDPQEALPHVLAAVESALTTVPPAVNSLYPGGKTEGS